MKAERCIVLCFAFAGDRLGGSHISLKGLLDELPKNLYRIVLVLEIPDGRIADYFSAYEQIRDPCALEKPFEVGAASASAVHFAPFPGQSAEPSY